MSTRSRRHKEWRRWLKRQRGAILAGLATADSEPCDSPRERRDWLQAVREVRQEIARRGE